MALYRDGPGNHSPSRFQFYLVAIMLHNMAICSWHWFKSLTMSALWVLANIWTQAALLMPLIACFYYPEQWYTNTRCPPTLILFQFFTHFEMFLNVNIFQTFFQRVRGESIICKYIHMCVCVWNIYRGRKIEEREIGRERFGLILRVNETSVLCLRS